MQIAHKVELDLTNKQDTYFKKACGVNRFAYNWALAEWQKIYDENRSLPKEHRTKLSGMNLKKKFNEIKAKEFPWTYEVTKYASQQPFLDLQDAWTRFFKKLSERPQFKKKGKSKDSFYVGGDQIKVNNKKIHIPNLGYVRMKEKLRFEGKINSVSFSRTADKWFAAIQVDANNLNLNLNLKEQKCGRHVGIDFGVKSIAVTSDGHDFGKVAPLRKVMRKLKRQQRKLSQKMSAAKQESRKLSESANFQKQKLKVSRIHYKVSCLRRDISHKLTTFLADNYTCIAIEDLNVRGMVKNHKLALSILDVGFGEMRRQLEYKTKMRGTHIELVDRFFPSSKKCSGPGCDFIHHELTLQDRVWSCPRCNTAHSRDFNAAVNLKNKIGGVPAESTPVEIAEMQRGVHPLIVTSIVESGKEHQILFR